ncbi:DUF4386 domain-containing protein [Echinicola salinicaeni]|uniref:DUF4386 domain-containing protein n=1 Tax=Echinicola salinicaeni TaxID=2762757 RepID=UPI001646A4CA|nr:DUF4386 domain-containing protein [Echinicola salinicaeni]
MTRVSTASNQKVARIAGLAYVLVILIGIFKVNFIEPVVVSHGTTELEASILANEFLFRIGIACETVMYLVVLVLSIALYILLKPVSKKLALSALCFRFGEAIIGTVSIILSGLIPLILLNKGPALDDSLLQTLIEVFINSRITALNIVLIFIGVGGTIFCYLFYISRFVPRILAFWGIVTYASMFILGFLNIITPERPDMIESILFSTGALFEIVFGIWLLFKGIRIKTENKIIA